MSDQRLYISSGGIGEVEFDSDEFDWFQTSNTEFNPDKTIPFFTLMSNLTSLTSRYHRNYARIGRYENYPETANEFIKSATKLCKSYAKIKKLSNNMIWAFDDALISDCMKVYDLYLEKKRFNIYPHIFVNIKIIEILPKINQNLLIIRRQIISLYRILKKLCRKKKFFWDRKKFFRSKTFLDPKKKILDQKKILYLKKFYIKKMDIARRLFNDQHPTTSLIDLFGKRYKIDENDKVFR